MAQAIRIKQAPVLKASCPQCSLSNLCLPLAVEENDLDRLEDIVAAIGRHMESGQQAYWVCPMVRDEEGQEKAAAEQRYAALKARFDRRMTMRVSMDSHDERVHDRERGPGAYAAPGRDGLLVGATMEVGEGQGGVDPLVAAGLAARAETIFPGLVGQAWSAAAGVRAATPDGSPLVGPSVSPRVILACGARRNGWLLAPLVGEVVAAHALARDPGPWAARLDPRRFGQ